MKTILLIKIKLYRDERNSGFQVWLVCVLAVVAGKATALAHLLRRVEISCDIVGGWEGCCCYIVAVMRFAIYTCCKRVGLSENFYLRC